MAASNEKKIAAAQNLINQYQKQIEKNKSKTANKGTVFGKADMEQNKRLQQSIKEQKQIIKDLNKPTIKTRGARKAASMKK